MASTAKKDQRGTEQLGGAAGIVTNAGMVGTFPKNIFSKKKNVFNVLLFLADLKRGILQTS